MRRGNRTGRMLFRTHGRIAMLTLICMAFALSLYGQEPSSHAPAATNSGSETVPELLKELDAMKSRIEKLEGQLHQRGAARATSWDQSHRTDAYSVSEHVDGSK